MRYERTFRAGYRGWQADFIPARVGSFFAAAIPILHPRQKSSDHEKAELVAAREKDENEAANRQTDTDADDAIAALEKTDDLFVSLCHGLSSLRLRPAKSR